MMISEEGEFFHIDFGYLFNTKTWFDGNRFAIPREMRQRLPEYMEQVLHPLLPLLVLLQIWLTQPFA